VPCRVDGRDAADPVGRAKLEVRHSLPFPGHMSSLGIRSADM